jgi:hypothetical protein
MSRRLKSSEPHAKIAKGAKKTPGGILLAFFAPLAIFV